MSTSAPRTPLLSILPSDGRLLFVTRIVRLFAYGFLSVVLALYLKAAGLSETRIGLLLTLTLVGDAAISLWLTTTADRIGQRRMLIIGAGLMVFAGVLFALTQNFILLLIAATIGVISPSGYEIGPFLSIEQASLSQVVGDQHRTRIFGWYNLVGTFATAVGSLIGGVLSQLLLDRGMEQLNAYRVIVGAYAAAGIGLALLFLGLSQSIEVVPITTKKAGMLLGLHRSKGVVAKLSALFALDAFGGGFVLQSMLALWFNLRFGVEPAALGAIFLGANVLAALSALSATHLASRIGIVNTMVFTHLPSNVLLILVPLMPNLTWAIIVLFIRFAISQMDVPTRQSYTMAVVSPDERSAAAGITGVARTVGAACSPVLAGPLLGAAALMSFPFFIAGGVKIVYDLLLYRSFVKLPPPEERPR